MLLNAKPIANKTSLKQAMIEDNLFAKHDVTGKYNEKLVMCLALTASVRICEEINRVGTSSAYVPTTGFFETKDLHQKMSCEIQSTVFYMKL